MNFHWRDGNRLQLLENGEEFFPSVFEAIASAEKEVLLETFILFEDKVGAELQRALIRAAENGASVDVTVDGYGSADLHGEFVMAMTQVGIRIHMFDPGPSSCARLPSAIRDRALRPCRTSTCASHPARRSPSSAAAAQARAPWRAC